jgi:hypothetical protein
MPDFVQNVETGLHRLSSGGWLTPATVAGITDDDFVNLSPPRRKELYAAVDRFRAVVTAPDGGASQEAAARAALGAIATVLQPYLTRESRKVCEVIAGAWREAAVADWIPTFDYVLDEDWTNAPAIHMWLILNDEVDVEAPRTQEELERVRALIHRRVREAGIERWPYASVRARADVQELAARVPA